ncbi:MAG: metallophosphoesterase [Desulfobacterota bacterium]|nr:metallophosphoesterase [Thermodesulfobacteriota bacterium]
MVKARRIFNTALLFWCCASLVTDAGAFLYETDPEVRRLVLKKQQGYPNASFIVFSDPHYFPPEFGTSGAAFEDYIRHDRKMIRESASIFKKALQDISMVAADFVLVCGDLTKDGEQESHRQVADLLQTLVDQGKQVIVVPGNHDVSNGMAMRYEGEEAEPVESVTPEMFRTIYRNCGFQDAIAQDPNSLSYISEPVPGLWVFAFDSCRYRENKPGEHSTTGGKFYDATLQWIEQMLIRALRENKAVIGCMHHGMVEHYPSNKKHFSDYLLDDFERIGKMCAAYGMRFVFTGHFHAQDITRKAWFSLVPNHVLVDIETGSLVTYPVPWRFVTIHNNRMSITTQQIQEIPEYGNAFLKYAYQFVLNGMTDIINEKLSSYGVPDTDQKLLTPQIAQAYVTHLKGDEIYRLPTFDFIGVSFTGILVGVVQGDLVRGWYRDLPPKDNNVFLNATTGSDD